MNREEICKIIDDKLDSKIKDFKNINPLSKDVRFFKRTIKSYRHSKKNKC